MKGCVDHLRKREISKISFEQVIMYVVDRTDSED